MIETSNGAHSSAVEISSPDRILRRASNEINAELTPGLIHEVNNILTGIYFNLETCSEFFDSPHPVAEALQEINQGVERIKEVLGRVTQVHLNVAEREISYHDMETLVASQIDLLRIIFPKTAKIVLDPPEEVLHTHVAEFPFRIAFLAIASRLRELFPSGKTQIPLAILTPARVADAAARAGVVVPPDSVAVSFRLPCFAGSVEEIDEYLSSVTEGDTTLGHAEVLAGELGGRLLVCAGADGKSSEVLLVLPRFDLSA